MHRRRVRALVALRFLVADLDANFEFVKTAVGHAVTMEIHVAPLQVRDEPVAVGGEQFRDQRRGLLGVCLDALLLAVHEIGQLAFHVAKRVVDDLRQRLVHVVLAGFFVGNEFVVRRHGHVDADVERAARVLGVVGPLDDHVAPGNMVAKLVEPVGLAPDQ